MAEVRFVPLVLIGLLGCESPAEPQTEPHGNTQSESNEPIDATSGGLPTDVIALAQSREPRVACALRRAGHVACWGANEWGQLGQGHYDPLADAVEVQGLRDAVSIVAHWGTICAVRHSGEVVCWGSAERGLLGSGNQLAHLGLFVVDPVRDAKQLFAGNARICATTSTSTWCWGDLDTLVGRHIPPAPHPLEQGDITALMLGERRSLARLGSGRVVSLVPSAELPEIVDAYALDRNECLVATGGEITCSLDGSNPKTLDALAGARALAFGPELGDVTGLLPDGTLKVVAFAYDGGPRVLEGAHDITTLALEGRPIVAATRDGRVLEWDRAGPAREIMMPPLGEGPHALARPTGALPQWCTIELDTLVPEPIAARVGLERSCKGIDVAPDTPSCPAEGPWLAVMNDYRVVLELALGKDRWAKIPTPVEHHYSNATDERVQRALVRSSNPLDVWLRTDEVVQLCKETVCDLTDTVTTHVVVTGLDRGDVLITTVRIRLYTPIIGKEHAARTNAVEVEVEGETVDVWACGGHVTLPLPLPLPLPRVAGPVAAPASDGSPSADEAAAAGKRCATGWTLFNAGDLANAKVEIDAALALLEQAESERGRKSLGACLYNRGRVAEREGDLAAARGFYERSLAVRPGNETVTARLDTLGTGP